MDSGGVQGPVHILGDIDLIGLPAAHGHLGQLLYFGLHSRPEGGRRQPHMLDQLGNQAVLLLKQRGHQMGLLDLLVSIFLGHSLGGLDGLQRFLGKFVGVHNRHAPFQVGYFFLW